MLSLRIKLEIGWHSILGFSPKPHQFTEHSKRNVLLSCLPMAKKFSALNTTLHILWISLSRLWTKQITKTAISFYFWTHNYIFSKIKNGHDSPLNLGNWWEKQNKKEKKNRSQDFDSLPLHYNSQGLKSQETSTKSTKARSEQWALWKWPGGTSVPSMAIPGKEWRKQEFQYPDQLCPGKGYSHSEQTSLQDEAGKRDLEKALGE